MRQFEFAVLSGLAGGGRPVSAYKKIAQLIVCSICSRQIEENNQNLEDPLRRYFSDDRLDKPCGCG